MADDSMPETRREAEALGADAVALADAYTSKVPATIWCVRV